jgi:DNA-binding transcriptional LysR family regulator
MATIDLNRAALFVKVVEAGSFTSAATSLAIPKSSVSRGVAQLEEDLGVRLLQRTTRKLHLTDAGQEYYQRVRVLVAGLAEAAEAVMGASRDPRGIVRITFPVEPFFALLVARFVRAHPGIHVEVIATGRRVDLVAEGVDLAVRAGKLDDSSLVARKVGTTGMGLFASPAYIERRGRPRSLADLGRHDCVLFRARAGRAVWRLEGLRGPEEVTVTGDVAVDDMLMARAFVIAGAGIGLLPATTLGEEIGAPRMVRLLPKYALRAGTLHVVWPSHKLVPTRVELLRDYLIAELPGAIRAMS